MGGWKGGQKSRSETQAAVKWFTMALFWKQTKVLSEIYQKANERAIEGVRKKGGKVVVSVAEYIHILVITNYV